MEFITQLWLPIIVCAVAVFFCSFLVWAILPHHRNDWSKLPEEEGFRDYVKSKGIAPGVYAYPFLDKNECNTPEGKAKFANGPSGTLSVWHKPNMGKNMALTLLVFFVASLLTAYVAWHVMGRDPAIAATHYKDFDQRFQVVGTIGLLTHCIAFLPNMIWFQGGKRAIVNGILDGVLYGVVTGAVFSWLWPTITVTLPG